LSGWIQAVAWIVVPVVPLALWIWQKGWPALGKLVVLGVVAFVWIGLVASVSGSGEHRGRAVERADL
jgi:hypothetical protein